MLVSASFLIFLLTLFGYLAAGRYETSLANKLGIPQQYTLLTNEGMIEMGTSIFGNVSFAIFLLFAYVLLPVSVKKRIHKLTSMPLHYYYFIALLYSVVCAALIVKKVITYDDIFLPFIWSMLGFVWLLDLFIQKPYVPLLLSIVFMTKIFFRKEAPIISLDKERPNGSFIGIDKIESILMNILSIPALYILAVFMFFAAFLLLAEMIGSTLPIRHFPVVGEGQYKVVLRNYEQYFVAASFDENMCSESTERIRGKNLGKVPIFEEVSLTSKLAERSKIVLSPDKMEAVHCYLEEMPLDKVINAQTRNIGLQK